MAALLNLRDLLTHEIDDLYSAEEQIIEALPKMVAKATDRELKKALQDHLAVTRNQKKRLDQVRTILKKGEAVPEEKKGLLSRIFGSTTKCKGTEGLITEGEKMMGEDMDPSVKDAAIIASAQKIEHYEISGYGTARAFALELKLTQVAELLQTTLNEEYAADDSLTRIATGKINLEAEKGSTSKSSGKKSAQDKPQKATATAKKQAPKKAAPKKAAKAAPKRTSPAR